MALRQLEALKVIYTVASGDGRVLRLMAEHRDSVPISAVNPKRRMKVVGNLAGLFLLQH